MRTTLEIDDDVLHAARRVAAANSKTLGKTISELARLGLSGRQSDACSSFPVFEVAPDASVITLELVKAALDE